MIRAKTGAKPAPAGGGSTVKSQDLAPKQYWNKAYAGKGSGLFNNLNEVTDCILKQGDGGCLRITEKKKGATPSWRR